MMMIDGEWLVGIESGKRYSCGGRENESGSGSESGEKASAMEVVRVCEDSVDGQIDTGIHEVQWNRRASTPPWIGYWRTAMRKLIGTRAWAGMMWMASWPREVGGYVGISIPGRQCPLPTSIGCRRVKKTLNTHL